MDNLEIHSCPLLINNQELCSFKTDKLPYERAKEMMNLHIKSHGNSRLISSTSDVSLSLSNERENMNTKPNADICETSNSRNHNPSNTKVLHYSEHILTQENKEIYRYGFNKNTKLYICLSNDCKTMIPVTKRKKFRHEGVTRLTLRNHTIKVHNLYINFKTQEISKALPPKCNTCQKTFSRKQ